MRKSDVFVKNAPLYYLLKLSLFLMVMSLCWPVMAQTKVDFVPDSVKMKTAKKDGWFPSMKASFSFSFAQSDGVVGVPDGTTLSLALQLDGGFLYSKGKHEWRTNTKMLHTQTKIPTLKPFLKSADSFNLETMYTYRFKSWIGAFISLKLDTALLAGYLVRDADTDLKVLKADGTALGAGKALKNQPFLMTNGFAPLMIKESFGLSIVPYEKPSTRVDIKVGLGAIEAFVSANPDLANLSGMIVADDDKTPELDVKLLQNYIQLGAELQLVVAGKIFGDVVGYTFLAEVMYPFVNQLEVGSDLKGIELLNIDVSLKLAVKLSKWASLNYSLSMVKAPLIVNEWQIVNSLLLTITASII